MGSRREFIKSVSALGIAGMVGAPATNSLSQTIAASRAKADDRDYWLATLEKISLPVLENLSRHKLKKNMPVEAADPVHRSQYTHLEAFGRLLAGIAPWLVLDLSNNPEAERQKKIIALTQASLDAATNPHSPDFMNFNRGGQPLVDTAFLAEGILRAPEILWNPLESRVQRQIVRALKSSRQIATPTDSNWVMFAAIVEAALSKMGEKIVEDRLEGSIRRMLEWYEGDGIYGDGEFFHWDYYNSFVIQPMLLDVLTALRKTNDQFESAYKIVLERSRRYAEILERLIAPDGSFPSMGRSTTYRFGALQTLAQIALMRELPARINPAQVRCAVTTVIRKMIEAPGTFNSEGWLQIGFCGHQPALAESYISTGSLYLCAAVFPPLGLPSTDTFWSSPATQWTQQRIWSGQNIPADHALRNDIKNVSI